MTSESAGRVHAIVPWAVLDTVRLIDAPPDDGMEEYHAELAVKRLGTSRTVVAHVERLRDLVQRGARVEPGEATALLRLVGRRSDAALVFSEAGRRAAAHVAERVAWPKQLVWHVLPGRLRARYGARVARGLLAKHFDVDLELNGTRLAAVARRSLAVDATPDGAACKFYGAAVGALLQRFTEFDDAVLHADCKARGSVDCRWMPARPAT